MAGFKEPSLKDNDACGRMWTHTHTHTHTHTDTHTKTHTHTVTSSSNLSSSYTSVTRNTCWITCSFISRYRNKTNIKVSDTMQTEPNSTGIRLVSMTLDRGEDQLSYIHSYPGNETEIQIQSFKTIHNKCAVSYNQFITGL